jgi:hypothetical protein
MNSTIERRIVTYPLDLGSLESDMVRCISAAGPRVLSYAAGHREGYHMSNGWDRARYEAEHVALSDDAESKLERGDTPESVVESLIERLKRPEMAGMLDFAASLERKPRKAYRSIMEREVGGRPIGDVRVGELRRGAAEKAVDAAINICIGERLLRISAAAKRSAARARRKGQG